MMRVVRWTAVIVLLLFLTHSDALAAKEPREQSWENLRQLQGGRKVQVVQMNLKSLKGTLLAVSEEAISLRVKQNEVTVPRPDVLRVSSLEQSKRLRNLLIGAAVGLGVGLGVSLGALAATGGSDDPGVVIAPAIAIGGGVGAGVGAAIPSHRTIYRAKRVGPRKSP